MSACQVIDETSAELFPNHESFGVWSQEFLRIPMVGEHVIKQGKWLKIKHVVWLSDGSAKLVVAWDGGLE